MIFLGAGASYPDGVPLQKDIVPEILNPRDERLKKSPMNSELARFIRKSFAYSDEEKIYPSLEVIFSYIDHFLVNETALSVEYPLDKLARIKDYLIKLIYHATSRGSRLDLPGPEDSPRESERESIYSSFWDQVAANSPNISIMTTNYDTQLEDAFDLRLHGGQGLIDHCVDFMDHEGGSPGELCGRVELSGPSTWPADGARPIKVIKLHGSLNWKYCACCNQALLTPCDTEIDLMTGDMPKARSRERGSLNGNTCPIDRFPLSVLIVPPSYSKSLRHPVIQRLLIEAANELRAVGRVVFVGYSFPEADVHVRALFQKNLARDTPVHVINPRASMKSRLDFGSLSNHVTFIEASFEETIRNGQLERLMRPRVARRAARNRPLRAGTGHPAT